MINPYLPCTEFIADGEPHQFGDRIYLYGSHDIYGKKWLCQGDYVCWSASVSDLTAWKYEGVIYERMNDPYIKEVVLRKKGTMFNQYLYAPDVVEINGSYYLYYGVAMSGAGIAVAKASHPTGPFAYVGRVRYPKHAKPSSWKDSFHGLFDGDRILGDGMPMIQLNPFKKYFGINMKNYVYDPAVLYDNGHLYLYYGCGYCYVVELSLDDMRTLVFREEVGSYITGPLLPSSSDKADKEVIRGQDGWHMGNGPSIRKINGRYYLSYYAVNDRHANAMCYSVADSPWGPYRYGGVLVSLGNAQYQGQTEPTAYGGNTHGGMIQVDGRWYQNYHRQTGDKWPARQACMTELLMDENGDFRQAEYSSSVEAEGGIKADNEIPAYTACVLTDENGVTKKGKSPYFVCRENDQVVKGLSEESVVGFKYLDFAESQLKECIVRLNNAKGGCVKIYFDKIENEDQIAEIKTVEKEDIRYLGKLTAPATGIHAVYFVFQGQDKKNTEFISFRFQ